MSHTNDIPCPFCDDATNEVEYDESHALLSIEGCEHGVSWTMDWMNAKNKEDFEKRIWQWISDYWAGRYEDAMEAKGDYDK